MMGRRVMAEPLFYTFQFEDDVLADHAWHTVDALLDATSVRRVMAPLCRRAAGTAPGWVVFH